ncbi:Protein of unknown function DUF1468 [Moorella glycerini]|uniref:Tripartite tricarboxylate transporter TctB family protein n=1 Tax=Neomoorella stamsii TaxID=1266720 RepID=A0A9X7P7I9_9FIRM|nr:MULTISPECIES: tripartite tricarboxylate transporter TctB family protein [Moorella]PRR77504.1 Tripartite tricarboxylate transporter TctB family protein [Moorella stamsii]CEP68253.1 Protein of unknown function DUF1468 [Moorella glycerini]
MESKGINEVKRSIPWIDLLLSLSCWLLALYILLAVRHFPRLTAAVEVVGSGFVPKLIAYCLVFLGAWLLVTSVLFRKEEVTKIEIGTNNLEKILLIVLLLGFKMLLPVLTFIPGTFLFVAISLKLFGERSLKNIIIISAVATLSLYYVFHSLLRMPLP